LCYLSVLGHWYYYLSCSRSYHRRSIESFYAVRWCNLRLDAPGAGAALGLLCRFLRLVSRRFGTSRGQRWHRILDTRHGNADRWAECKLACRAMATGGGCSVCYWWRVGFLHSLCAWL